MKRKIILLSIYLLVTTLIGSVVTITRGSTDEYTKYAVGGELIPVNLTQLLSQASANLVTISAVLIGIFSAAYILRFNKTKLY
jgi:hypothetical protein